MKNSYPDSFFPIENPSSPWTEIQFRTAIDNSKEISDASQWTSITINPSNFFNSFSIEDQGGAQMLTLNLYDKNFANIENIVVKSIVSAILANHLVKDPNYSTDKTDSLQFYINKSSSVNLRLRFGYSQWDSADSPYIDEINSANQGWIDRINNDKPVIRSPWLYFQMGGADFSLKEDGEHISIKAFSIVGRFLDKAQMLQKYAKLSGTPTDILTNIEKVVQKAAAKSGDQISFVIEPADGYKTRDGGEEIIEIMLGGIPDYRKLDNGTKEEIPQYKSLREILDDICSKVKPKIYDTNGNLVQPTQDSSSTGNGINQENQDSYRTFPYGYSIEESSNSSVIHFYYKDPQNGLTKQPNVRTYPWLAYGQSLLKDVSIQSNGEFAALNLQIATINRDGGNVTLHVATGKGTNGNVNQDSTGNDTNKVDFTIGNIKDASAALNSSDFNAMFVTNIREAKPYETTNDKLTADQAGAILARNIVTNLNTQEVFKGSITIPGDPFYLFDSSIQPFLYVINLVIKRPNYVGSDGTVIDGGLSYLSGYYTVNKITHNVGLNGFETVLEVMKFPSFG